MDCIFCKIIAGEIPSNKVYEDDRVLAFRDINPQTPVHILVIPKHHIASVDELNADNSDIVAHIFAVIPKIAKEAGLEIYQKADSQDICFVADGHYSELISKLRPHANFSAGEIVDTSGKVLGHHQGLIHYTVGQRRGMGIGGGNILYVIKLDAKNNRLIVGSKEELLSQKVHIRELNWLAEKIPESQILDVKLRSRQKIIKAEVFFNAKQNTAEIHLLEDFYGTAPGQVACFYDGSRVLGGGIITELTNL